MMSQQNLPETTNALWQIRNMANSVDSDQTLRSGLELFVYNQQLSYNIMKINTIKHILGSKFFPFEWTVIEKKTPNQNQTADSITAKLITDAYLHILPPNVHSRSFCNVVGSGDIAGWL